MKAKARRQTLKVMILIYSDFLDDKDKYDYCQENSTGYKVNHHASPLKAKAGLAVL